eukprot:scaffold9450_cov88-Phaeocystis_antarctica.AAC.2
MELSRLMWYSSSLFSSSTRRRSGQLRRARSAHAACVQRACSARAAHRHMHVHITKRAAGAVEDGTSSMELRAGPGAERAPLRSLEGRGNRFCLLKS